jgi:serine/threonine protein kinase
MSPSQKELLDRLFGEAVTLPRDSRGAFIAEHCPDEEVKAELESLLAFATQPGKSGFAELISEAAGSMTSGPIGQTIGVYRIAAQIGQGGMGAVYRGVRDDDQYQQTVAIKLLRFGYANSIDIQRFRRERQILATLEHPYIARLMDGGAWVPPGSSESQPYLVMEYVEGLPVTTYCEQNRLNIRQRLQLFCQICEALTYAHQQLIVHRDIKPANILVTASGVPKLLDFGIAKLLAPEPGTAAAPLTSGGYGPFTPEYASPEQVRGQAVSTQSDVFSLGVVLYQLLTGRPLYQFVDHSPEELMREMFWKAVTPPSTAGGRHLRGDLDVIVLKALEKDTARRYQSVERLAEDIRRHLAGLPIEARPDRLYRAVKFVQRHRVAAGSAVVVFMALVGGIGVSTWQAIRASRAEKTALLERDRAQAINDFLQNDVLAQAGNAQGGPTLVPNPDLKVRTALDRAAARITGRFDKQPLLEASLRQTIGTAYRNVVEFPSAAQQFERALELRRRALGDQHNDTLRSMADLAQMYGLEQKFAQAEALYANVLNGQRRLLGEEHPETLTTQHDLGALYRDERKFPESEAIYQKTLNARKRVLGPEHRDTLTTIEAMVILYLMEGKNAQGLELGSKTLEAERRVRGEDSPQMLAMMSLLGLSYAREGKYALAEPLLSKVLEVQRRGLGEENSETLGTMMNLADVYEKQGKVELAAELRTKATAGAGRGRVEQVQAVSTSNIADDSPAMYKFQAEQYGAVLKALRRTTGDQGAIRDGLVTLGQMQFKQRLFLEAEWSFREALNSYEKENVNDWQRYSCQGMLGASLAGQRKFAEAEPQLLAGFQGMLGRLNSANAESRPEVLDAGDQIIQMYQDWGKPEKAAEWREKIKNVGR